MKKYHYTECGLENIYLVNGFKITKFKNGDEEIFIHDIHGLHRAIGMILVSKAGLLLGDEIKFIRTTLDLSQTGLAKLLGLSDHQSVLAWEKNKYPIPKTADHLLRAIFFGYLNVEESRLIYDKINEIADLDAKEIKNQKAERIELEEISDEWRRVA